MRIDKAGHNRFAIYVEHFGARGNAAFRAHALDAAVFDDDIGVLQNLIAFHRHYGRAAQDDGAFWRFSGEFEVDRDFLDILFQFFQFLFFFFLVFLLILFFVFLRISRLRSGIRLVRILLIGVLGVRVFKR